MLLTQAKEARVHHSSCLGSGSIGAYSSGLGCHGPASSWCLRQLSLSLNGLIKLFKLSSVASCMSMGKFHCNKK
jgi:hypothetical protein